MENLKDTKTADLIADYNLLNQPFPHLMTRIRATNPKKAIIERDGILSAIAAELDRRATEAGLSIVGGKLLMQQIAFCGEDGEGCYDAYHWTVQYVENPTELHALLGWLLLKEGGNNG